MRSLYILLLAALPVYASATHEKKHCFHYDASGSVSIPFPQPPNASLDSPTGNFTLSTYLELNASNPGTLSINDYFSTTSAGWPVQARTYDYQGCIIRPVSGKPLPSTKNHINEAGPASCSAALSSGCISELMTNIQSTARSFSQQNSPHPADLCSRLYSFPSEKKCPIDGVLTAREYKGLERESMYRGLVLISSFSALFPVQPDHLDLFSKEHQNCSGHSINMGSTALGFPYYGNGKGDKEYLKYLNGAVPVVTVAWVNASANGGQPWAETRVFCITADNVVPGTISGASFLQRPSWYLVMVFGAVAMVTFML